jgi:hypothetical protein
MSKTMSLAVCVPTVRVDEVLTSAAVAGPGCLVVAAANDVFRICDDREMVQLPITADARLPVPHMYSA